MIKLECNDESFFKVLNNLFEQKDLINKVKSDRYFVIVKIKTNINNISLEINGKKNNLPLPIDINNLLSHVLQAISNIKHSIKGYDYYPYQRLIIVNNKKSFLSDIQNTIISNLIISTEGMNKDALYSIIWKKDKDVSMNKLDTHLTNLKNQIIKDLDIIINFQSQDKTLKLLID